MGSDLMVPNLILANAYAAGFDAGVQEFLKHWPDFALALFRMQEAIECTMDLAFAEHGTRMQNRLFDRMGDLRKYGGEYLKTCQRLNNRTQLVVDVPRAQAAARYCEALATRVANYVTARQIDELDYLEALRIFITQTSESRTHLTAELRRFGRPPVAAALTTFLGEWADRIGLPSNDQTVEHMIAELSAKDAITAVEATALHELQRRPRYKGEGEKVHDENGKPLARRADYLAATRKNYRKQLKKLGGGKKGQKVGLLS